MADPYRVVLGRWVILRAQREDGTEFIAGQEYESSREALEESGYTVDSDVYFDSWAEALSWLEETYARNVVEWKKFDKVLIRKTREAGIVMEIRERKSLREYRVEPALIATALPAGQKAAPQEREYGEWYQGVDLVRER